MASDSEASCESDPNFAVICAFMEKFGVTCGLATIDFLELQEMLENTQEVSQELIDLHIKLLRKSRKSVSTERWEKAIIKFCYTFCVQDAWEIERFGYKKARLSSKLRILKELLELQFDFNVKFKSEINKMSADELRSQPLGKDKLGHAYWFQSDNNCQIRVYKEDPDEETWTLVAKDREGLVTLITELSDGDSKLSSESTLNEDSNSMAEKPIIDTGQLESSTSDSKKSDDSENSNESKKERQDETVVEKLEQNSESDDQDKKTLVNLSEVLPKRPRDSIDDGDEKSVKKTKIEPEVSDAVEEPVLLVKGEGSGCENECVDNYEDNPIESDVIEEPVMYVFGLGSGSDCQTGNEQSNSKNQTQAMTENSDGNVQDNKKACANANISEKNDSNLSIDVANSKDEIDISIKDVPISPTKNTYKLGTIIDTKTDNKSLSIIRSPTKKSRWDVENLSNSTDVNDSNEAIDENNQAKLDEIKTNIEPAQSPKKPMFFFGPGCFQFKSKVNPISFSATVGFGQKVPQSKLETSPNVPEIVDTDKEKIDAISSNNKRDIDYRIDQKTSEDLQSSETEKNEQPPHQTPESKAEELVGEKLSKMSCSSAIGAVESKQSCELSSEEICQVPVSSVKNSANESGIVNLKLEHQDKKDIESKSGSSESSHSSQIKDTTSTASDEKKELINQERCSKELIQNIIVEKSDPKVSKPTTDSISIKLPESIEHTSTQLSYKEDVKPVFAAHLPNPVDSLKHIQKQPSSQQVSSNLPEKSENSKTGEKIIASSIVGQDRKELNALKSKSEAIAKSIVSITEKVSTKEEKSDTPIRNENCEPILEVNISKQDSSPSEESRNLIRNKDQSLQGTSSKKNTDTGLQAKDLNLPKAAKSNKAENKLISEEKLMSLESQIITADVEIKNKSESESKLIKNVPIKKPDVTQIISIKSDNNSKVEKISLIVEENDSSLSNLVLEEPPCEKKTAYICGTDGEETLNVDVNNDQLSRPSSEVKENTSKPESCSKKKEESKKLVPEQNIFDLKKPDVKKTLQIQSDINEINEPLPIQSQSDLKKFTKIKSESDVEKIKQLSQSDSKQLESKALEKVTPIEKRIGSHKLEPEDQKKLPAQGGSNSKNISKDVKQETTSQSVANTPDVTIVKEESCLQSNIDSQKLDIERSKEPLPIERFSKKLDLKQLSTAEHKGDLQIMNVKEQLPVQTRDDLKQQNVKEVQQPISVGSDSTQLNTEELKETLPKSVKTNSKDVDVKKSLTMENKNNPKKAETKDQLQAHGSESKQLDVKEIQKPMLKESEGDSQQTDIKKYLPIERKTNSNKLDLKQVQKEIIKDSKSDLQKSVKDHSTIQTKISSKELDLKKAQKPISKESKSDSQKIEIKEQVPIQTTSDSKQIELKEEQKHISIGNKSDSKKPVKEQLPVHSKSDSKKLDVHNDTKKIDLKEIKKSVPTKSDLQKSDIKEPLPLQSKSDSKDLELKEDQSSMQTKSDSQKFNVKDIAAAHNESNSHESGFKEPMSLQGKDDLKPLQLKELKKPIIMHSKTGSKKHEVTEDTEDSRAQSKSELQKSDAKEALPAQGTSDPKKIGVKERSVAQNKSHLQKVDVKKGQLPVQSKSDPKEIDVKERSVAQNKSEVDIKEEQLPVQSKSDPKKTDVKERSVASNKSHLQKVDVKEGELPVQGKSDPKKIDVKERSVDQNKSHLQKVDVKEGQLPVQSKSDPKKIDVKVRSVAQNKSDLQEVDIKEQLPVQSKSDVKKIGVKERSIAQNKRDLQEVDIKEQLPVQSKSDVKKIDVKERSIAQNKSDLQEVDIKEEQLPVQSKSDPKKIDVKERSVDQNKSHLQKVDLKEGQLPVQSKSDPKKIDVKARSVAQNKRDLQEVDIKEQLPVQSKSDVKKIDVKERSIAQNKSDLQKAVVKEGQLPVQSKSDSKQLDVKGVKKHILIQNKNEVKDSSAIHTKIETKKLNLREVDLSSTTQSKSDLKKLDLKEAKESSKQSKSELNKPNLKDIAKDSLLQSKKDLQVKCEEVKEPLCVKKTAYICGNPEKETAKAEVRHAQVATSQLEEIDIKNKTRSQAVNVPKKSDLADKIEEPRVKSKAKKVDVKEEQKVKTRSGLRKGDVKEDLIQTKETEIKLCDVNASQVKHQLDLEKKKQNTNLPDSDSSTSKSFKQEITQVNITIKEKKEENLNIVVSETLKKPQLRSKSQANSDICKVDLGLKSKSNDSVGKKADTQKKNFAKDIPVMEETSNIEQDIECAEGNLKKSIDSGSKLIEKNESKEPTLQIAAQAKTVNKKETIQDKKKMKQGQAINENVKIPQCSKDKSWNNTNKLTEKEETKEVEIADKTERRSTRRSLRSSKSETIKNENIVAIVEIPDDDENAMSAPSEITKITKEEIVEIKVEETVVRRGRSRRVDKPEIDIAKKAKVSNEVKPEETVVEGRTTRQMKNKLKENKCGKIPVVILDNKTIEEQIDEADDKSDSKEIAAGNNKKKLDEVIVIDNSSNSCDVINENPPESSIKEEEKQAPVSLSTFSLDFNDTPPPPVTRRGLRKRGRESSPLNIVENDETAGKKMKMKGKRSIDLNLRKSIEQKKEELISISSDDDNSKKELPLPPSQSDQPVVKRSKKKGRKKKKVSNSKNVVEERLTTEHKEAVVTAADETKENQVESTSKDKNEIESTSKDKNEIESTNVDEKQIESTNVDKKQIESTSVDKKQIESTSVDKKQIESTSVDKKQIESTNKDQNQIESTNNDSEEPKILEEHKMIIEEDPTKSDDKNVSEEIGGGGKEVLNANLDASKVDTDLLTEKKKKTSNKNKRMLSNLGITAENQMDIDAITPVRQSRRIAQLKIREEAERRKLEEELAREIQDTLKKKKKKSDDKDYKAEKRKPKVESEEEEDAEKDKEKKRKKKRKKNKDPRKLFDEFNPWKSSSDSSSESEDEEEEMVEEDYDEEPMPYISDHEFSPESDIEGGEAQPLKRARTARKESEDEEVDDCPCQKCKKSDHPEWILLCDQCDNGWHCSCLRPPLLVIPEGDWFCPPCQHIRLLQNLRDRLVDFDKRLSKKEIEDRRKERLAYVGISLNNVLPAKDLDAVKKKRRESQDFAAYGVVRGGFPSSSDESDSGQSETETSGSESDEPTYQLRQRRQAHSYRFNDYDELINSAIQEEMEAVKGAGNQGRGKDIATIVNAEKEEERKKSEAAAAQEVPVVEGPEPLPPLFSEENREPQPLNNDEDEDDEIIRPVKKRPGQRKKSRKLNALDISSADDEDSDEDFKGSSSDSEEEFDDDLGSEDSEDLETLRGRRKNQDPVRRSTRARISRYDADFIDDGDSDDDAPRRKKKKSYWAETESEEESDRSWGRRKRKPARGHRRTTATVTKKRKTKKKKKRDEDSDVEVYRKKKPKIKFGLDEEEEVPGRRTRGKKINYVDALGSDSEEDRVKRPPPRIESEEEYVANEDEDLDEDDKVSEDYEVDSSEEAPLAKATKVLGQSYVPHSLQQSVVQPPPSIFGKMLESNEDEQNPLDEINKNLEEMDEHEMQKMMEEEEYANKQLQLVALQLEREKKRKEREGKMLDLLAVSGGQDVVKKRGRKPKAQFEFPPEMEDSMMGNVESLIVNTENNDELSEPPGVSLPLFADIPVPVDSLEEMKKRKVLGRGKKNIEETVASLGASLRQPELGGYIGGPKSVITQETNIEIAAPPQPFSQSQPTPSVITRMLQNKPGQPGYPVGTIRPKQFAAMPEREDEVPATGPPPHQGPPPYISGALRSQLTASPYRQMHPAPNHYPRAGPPPSSHQIRNPAPQAIPSHIYHRTLDPAAASAGGGAVNLVGQGNSPGRVASPALASPGSGVGNGSKNDTPPPPYIRPSVNRFPVVTTARQIHAVPPHIQSTRANVAPFQHNLPPNYQYPPFSQAAVNTDEGLPPPVYQNSPYAEQYTNEEGVPINPDNANKSFEEESGGEFGGLVSYFSSQREDDLES